MTTQGKFHITTKNGRQRARWLELFGTDMLPVTNAHPQEVFYKDGRSQWTYTLDTAALGEHNCRRLAAHIAARRWGTTFESALAEVRRGWPVHADGCQLVNEPLVSDEPVTESTAVWSNSPAVENSRPDAPETITRPTVLPNGRAPRPQRKTRQGRAYGRLMTGAIPGQMGLSLPGGVG